MKSEKKLISIFILLAMYTGLTGQDNYSKEVDVFIGTGGDNHCFPGAVYPFGMVQVSPDTRVKGRHTSAGYHYDDSTIIGFSHNHLSGTGPGTLADGLFMPTTGKVIVEPGTVAQPAMGYRSRFSRKNEKAYPGYYSVYLDDYNVKVELTAAKRAAMHRYTFPASDQANVLIDLGHHIHSMGEQVLLAELEVLNDTTIRGYRVTTGGWAVNCFFYFHAIFSKPFVSYGTANGDEITGNKFVHGSDIQAFVKYKTENEDELLVKVGISAVDYEGAKKNLEESIPSWDFEGVKKEAGAAWNDYLGKIEVKGGTKNQRTIFYTSMYHTGIAPHVFSDVDGRYRTIDRKVSKVDKLEHYTTFSIWDTYRASHPLYNIIQPGKSEEMVFSLLQMYDNSYRNILPIWPLWGVETHCMTGYHAASIIAEAYIKGIVKEDEERAYSALKDQATNMNYRSLEYYDKLGYIPYDRDHPNIKNETKLMDHWAPNQSASRTIEYSYDDYSVARFAKLLNKKEDYRYFLDRSKNYKNLFDPDIGFMRARKYNGEWKPDFDPLVHYKNPEDFIEGTGMQYTFAMQHDPAGLADLLGGYNELENHLDLLFSTPYDGGNHNITSLIGQYSQGNEPCHHIAYMYNYCGVPWKGQEKLQLIMDSLYTTAPDGYPGNEDVGAMSAWYIFSAMGFYPVSPVSGNYVFGTPLFPEIVIHLKDNKKFIVKANDVSKNAYYIKDVKFNGKQFENTWFTHDMLINGGELIFQMDEKPNPEWGNEPRHFPLSAGE